MPSQKFAYNQFAVQLEENKMLTDFLDDKKLTWDEDIEFIRKMCNQIEQSQIYKDYMAVAESDLKKIVSCGLIL